MNFSSYESHVDLAEHLRAKAFDALQDSENSVHREYKSQWATVASAYFLALQDLSRNQSVPGAKN